MLVSSTELMWWVTVAAYGGTAVLCGLCAKRVRPSALRSGNFWWLLAAIMLLLGVNKQGNLVGRLTTEGRLLAWAGDWYQSRIWLQAELAVMILLLAAGFLVWLWRWARPLSSRQKTAVIGVAFLLGFDLLRAISLHAVDAFLYRPVLGIYPNWLLELGGIALVAIPALSEWRRPLSAGTRSAEATKN